MEICYVTSINDSMPTFDPPKTGETLLSIIEPIVRKLPALRPLPTAVEPDVHPDPALKAVVFDIYGTLLISSSGDIDGFSLESGALGTALEALGDGDDTSESVCEKDLWRVLSIYKPTIQRTLGDARKQGAEYPEINIVSIWERIIAQAIENRWLASDRSIDCRRLAFIFELISNKVHPMPGMRETLKQLRNSRIPLGIVSNAQFYTPIIMNYFLDGRLRDGERISGFDMNLTVFSYKRLRAKPDPTLFEGVAETLRRQYGVAPNETLYVGNDMYKDVWPANRVGFKTALFAGDRRSLRLREDKANARGLKPDFVITDLKQLNTIMVAS